MALEPDNQNPSDESEAPFAPPEVPVEVECLHCGETYQSDQMQLRYEGPDGELAWVCATPGCGALGFGFDILPTDPNYRDENGGWISDDEYDGAVDEALLDEQYSGDGTRVLRPTDAEDEVGIDYNGDGESNRKRLFGESDQFEDDDIPF